MASRKRRPRLSIVVPAFQEAKRIESTLETLAAYLKEHKYQSTEVVVVTADSPDGTAGLAQAKSALFDDFRFVSAGPKAGKGRDVRLGMLSAKGDYRIFMDADLATPLHHLETAQQLMDRADVAIAVRNLARSHHGIRRWLSAGGNLLVRLLLPGIKDSQCGFKMFSAEAAEEIFRRQTILGWGFDMEILTIARHLGYRVRTFDVADWADKPDGTFEDHIGSAALQTLRELLTIWRRKLLGQYRLPTFTDQV